MDSPWLVKIGDTTPAKMIMVDREALESRLNYAKTMVADNEKIDKVDGRPNKNNYYWGGYVAALNFVLGREND